MAKSKKKKVKSGLPKRIAGIKVPKELRRSGGTMLTLAQTPVVREIIASGLVAAAAAITGSDKTQKVGKKAKRQTGKIADTGLHQMSEIGQAASAAVVAAMEKWFGGSSISAGDKATPLKTAGKHKGSATGDDAVRLRH